MQQSRFCWISVHPNDGAGPRSEQEIAFDVNDNLGL